ncbi:MAG: primosomal protein N' [Deltaproteobacteria bacterium]|nr:MAG: primosomal protein N' [Deltaproteobacteria bacterium]
MLPSNVRRSRPAAEPCSGRRSGTGGASPRGGAAPTCSGGRRRRGVRRALRPWIRPVRVDAFGGRRRLGSRARCRRSGGDVGWRRGARRGVHRWRACGGSPAARSLRARRGAKAGRGGLGRPRRGRRAGRGGGAGDLGGVGACRGCGGRRLGGVRGRVGRGVGLGPRGGALGVRRVRLARGAPRHLSVPLPVSRRTPRRTPGVVMPRRITVAVPTAVDRAFTYAVAEDAAVPRPGSRVLVPFGRRVVLGIVLDRPPEDVPEAKLRAVVADLDEGGAPTMDAELLSLAEWISDYYLAPIGEVVRTMLPGRLARSDARRIVRTDRPATSAPDDVRPLLSAVEEAGPKGLAAARLARLGIRRPFATLARAEALGLVEGRWEDDAAPRTETFVRATVAARRDVLSEEELSRVAGRSKQRRLLLDRLQTALDDAEGAGDPEAAWVALSELRADVPRARSLLAPLVEAGLVALSERPRREDPFAASALPDEPPPTPTADQRRAIDEAVERLGAGRFACMLLHGITGSGKTEVYLRLIERVRAEGGGAMVLVPEIALTPQLGARFRARFGDEVAVLHSGLSPRQRLDAWHAIRDGRRSIVIGVRSAVFAPVPNLRIVVVDEEHDPSFKQDEGVRYHARDVALVRAKAREALALLGSATPALETYARAKAGEIGYVRLATRPTPRPLPEVEIVSLAVHRPDPASGISGRLMDAIRETVSAGRQVLLFLNRRGYAPSLQCTTCGAFVACPDCTGPAMTFHLRRNRIVCHLCGHIDAVPERCPSCGQPGIATAGAGTERVELELERALPGTSILRLDRDTSYGARLHRTLETFRRGKAQILVGTQMLTKGHDFPGVTLVGVLRADHGLGVPDPRAAERVFQLVTQVAGRAGRGSHPGRVIVQAYAVQHPAVVHAAAHDYEAFAATELALRRELGNPPFGHLALVRVVGEDEAAVDGWARRMAQGLRARVSAVGDVMVLGPAPAFFARVNRRYRMQILLRSPRRSDLRRALRVLRPALGAGRGGVHVSVDVDPQVLA